MKTILASLCLALLCAACSTITPGVGLAPTSSGPPAPPSSTPSRGQPAAGPKPSTVVIATFAAADNRTGWTTLGWTASPSSTVTGYKIYIGPSHGTYTNRVDVGNVLSATISNQVVGATYYYTATAYDSQGRESIFSNEATNTIPVPVPMPPGGLMILSTQVAQSVTGPWTNINQFPYEALHKEVFRLEITKQ